MALLMNDEKCLYEKKSNDKIGCRKINNRRYTLVTKMERRAKTQKNNATTVFIFASCFTQIIGNALVDGCKESAQTVVRVPVCPRNETEWAIRAKEKDCHNVNQECTTNDNFVYHCLINSNINETLEICAPVIYLDGYCCEYNTRGNVVQRNFNAYCGNFSTPCKEYRSDEIYKYQECFDLMHKKSNNNDENENGVRDLSTVNDSSPSYVLIAVFAGSGIIILIVFLAYRKQQGNGFRNIPEVDPQKNITFTTE